MNKIYKLVWNASIAAWAVVSELTSSKTKAKKASLATAMAMTGLLAMTQQAAAYEAGGGNTNHSCTNYSTTGTIIAKKGPQRYFIVNWIIFTKPSALAMIYLQEFHHAY